MSVVRIFVDDIELDFVKKSLTIKKDNNALIPSFRVSHSSYPFLIIENEKAKQALGPKDITSINKTKSVAVTVIELGERYYGELQILSYLNGFRKCNLKYATEMLTIVNRPINEFLPVVSVIPGENDPEPFVEESDTAFEGDEHWATYPVQFLNKIYPEVKWQFPTMYWEDRIEDLEDNDAWTDYTQEINRYKVNPNTNQTEFYTNSFELEENDLTVTNTNIAAPQLFLLTPLYYALKSIGFTLAGTFPNNAFIKRILLLSQKDNITKMELTATGHDLELAETWYTGTFTANGQVFNNYYRHTPPYQLTLVGNYAVRYRFVLENDPNVFQFSGLFLYTESEISNVFNPMNAEFDGTNYVIEGEVSFSIDIEELNSWMFLRFLSIYQMDPVEHEITVVYTDAELDFFQMHPTIDFKRYCPSWTTATYINELKNTFNLDIEINDIKKELTLNFLENINETEVPEILKKDLLVKDYDTPENTSFLLKFNNDEDTPVFIDANGVATENFVTNAFTKEIKNRFKNVPTNNYTAHLSEDLQSKSGTGLMLYDPLSSPFIISHYYNQTLQLHGDFGIYNVYWKKWLKFRINASSVEMSGPFTETELSKFVRAKSIYVNNQYFRIASLRIKEDTQNLVEVRFQLESVNY